MKWLSEILDKISLRHILIIAVIFRVLAVIFSKGYAFSDDHFEVIEVSEKLLHGARVLSDGGAYIFSLIYPLSQSFIFWICQAIGMDEPEFKMLAIRFFHAAVSIITVFFGYKLAEKISGQKIAAITGLLLAVFWFFPFMSVRSLREFICIAPLMAAFYFMYGEDRRSKHYVYAGCMLALAFVFRLQTVFFPIGIGLALLFQGKWKNLTILTLSTLGFLAITQGLFDYLYWGDPMASISAYLKYNMLHGNTGEYPVGPWYKYFGTVFGLMLPPLSLFLLAGYIRSAKINPEMFWGSLLFFALHCYFPNKQERFILPFFPFLIVLGIAGLDKLRQEHRHSLLHGSVFRFSLWAFIIANSIALCVLSVTYSKLSRVESMHWFYNKKDVHTILLANDGGIPFPPVFYSGRQLNLYQMNRETDVENLKEEIKKTGNQPQYLVITGDNGKEKTLQKLAPLYPHLNFQASFEPSFVDNIAYHLNPKHNVNETWHIYQIQP